MDGPSGVCSSTELRSNLFSQTRQNVRVLSEHVHCKCECCRRLIRIVQCSFWILLSEILTVSRPARRMFNYVHASAGAIDSIEESYCLVFDQLEV